MKIVKGRWWLAACSTANRHRKGNVRVGKGSKAMRCFAFSVRHDRSIPWIRHVTVQLQGPHHQKAKTTKQDSNTTPSQNRPNEKPPPLAHRRPTAHAQWNACNLRITAGQSHPRPRASLSCHLIKNGLWDESGRAVSTRQRRTVSAFERVRTT